jgi:hypothetical protein
MEFIDTVEVWGSSPHGSTISSDKLAYTTQRRQAPNGSTKDAYADLGHLIFPTSGLVQRLPDSPSTAQSKGFAGKNRATYH